LEISVLAIGRLKAGPERELCERYLERARKTGEFNYDEKIEGLQALDRYTLRIRFKQPDFAFKWWLTTSSFAAVAREVVEKYQDAASTPVTENGIGPSTRNAFHPASIRPPGGVSSSRQTIDSSVSVRVSEKNPDGGASGTGDAGSNRHMAYAPGNQVRFRQACRGESSINGRARPAARARAGGIPRARAGRSVSGS